MNRSIYSLGVGLALGLIACFVSPNAPAATAPQVTVLDANASQLRADFNRSQGNVRLLFVVDPACSV